MLETIRAYAAEKLNASGEFDEIARRHAAFFAAAVQDEDADPGVSEGLDWMDQEVDNIRAALESGRTTDMLALVTRLGPYWFRRGPVREAAQWFKRALDHNPEPSALRADALHQLAGLSSSWGDFETAFDAIDESLDWYRSQDRLVEVACTLFIRGETKLIVGRISEAGRDLEDAVAIATDAGADEVVADCAYALSYVALHDGRFADAERHAQVVYDYHARFDRPNNKLGSALMMLANVSYAQGAWDTAIERCDRAIELFERFGDEGNRYYALWERAKVDVVLERYDAGIERLERSLEISRDVGEIHTSQIEAYLAHARGLSGDVHAALDSLGAIIERSRSSGDDLTVAVARLLRSDLHLTAGERGRAADDARDSLIAFDAMSSRVDMVLSMARLGCASDGSLAARLRAAVRAECDRTGHVLPPQDRARLGTQGVAADDPLTFAEAVTLAIA